MRATKTLPDGYQAYATIALAKNWRLLLSLSLAGVALVFGFGWLVVRIGVLLRPDVATLLPVVATAGHGGISLTLHLVWLPEMLAAFVLVPVLHEATHGVVFWLFTRERPRFAYRIVNAYTAAPQWYLPRGAYLLVGLAPLLVLSLLGVAALAGAPLSVVPGVIAGLVLNAAGAVGDIAVSCWLIVQPATLLARDAGDAVTLYCAVRAPSPAAG
jgi:hypothetical protein